MIGAPGAGKSNYCNRERQDLEVISCDQLREKYFGDARSYEIREIIKNKIKEILNEKVDKSQDVVIDTTYFNEKEERRFLFSLGEDVKINAIYIKSSLDRCLKQNKMRPCNRVVPDEMVIYLYRKLCEPNYDEGFASIITFTQHDFTA